MCLEMDGVERTGVMIDRPGSRDRDDAIAVRRTSDGWRADVYIAAAARLVPAGSPTDLTARRRLHTRYLPNRTLRMLAERDERRAALAADRPCDTLRFRLDFDSGGGLREIGIGPDRLESGSALSYEEAADAIAEPEHPAHPILAPAHELARALLVRRRAGGALAVYDLTHGWATDEDGNVVHLGDTERNAGYIVVQEMMIAANAAAARWCAERDVPILFRNHRISTVAPPREALLDDLEAVETDPVNARLEALTQRLALVQRPAVYEPHVSGHYALNLPAYTHVTSPLRRYADLVNQRILFAVAEGEPSPYSPEDLAALAEDITDRVAAQRERRAERFRSAALAETRQQLQAGGYASLRASDFHKVVEVALTEDRPPDGLAEELRLRIASGKLAPRVACRILFGGGAGWHETRSAVLDWVTHTPAHAITLITMYAAMEQLEPVEWETTDAGPSDGPAVFGARVALDPGSGVVWSPRRLGAAKKLARQQAALGLLADLAELPDPSRDLASPTVGRVAPSELPRIPADQHPVMTINQLTQLGVLLDVSWSYDSTGPAHEPRHQCRLHVLDSRSGSRLESSGVAGAKSAAKAAAAATLLTDLRAGDAGGRAGG